MASFLFVLCAISSIACAIALVTRKNPIYSAFFMMGLFISISVMFALLAAPFLAAMQLVVYAGAILVLFLFVIMLLNLSPEEHGAEPSRRARAFAGALAGLLFAALAAATCHAEKGLAEVPARSADFGSASWVGSAIFRAHVLPFEVVSILILVAVIGAVVLAKKSL